MAMTVKELISILEEYDGEAQVNIVEVDQAIRPIKSVFDDTDHDVYISCSV